MGCCQSSSNNALGDIALHANNNANADSHPASAPKEDTIDDGTSSLINQILEQITKDPMIFPKDINSTILWNIGLKIGKSSSSLTPQATQLVDIIQNHFDQQFDIKAVQLHFAYIYMFSEISFRSNKEQYSTYCKYVYEDASQLLNNFQITKSERLYLKSILAWNLKGDSKYFVELKQLSQNILTQLAEPLLVEYKHLEQQNDEILSIEISHEYSYKQGNFELNPSFIRKDIMQISNDIFKWYNKGFIVETKCEPIIVKQFANLGFDISQTKQWLDGIRNTHKQLEPSLVLRELLWRMAMRIDDEFQALTKQCFKENHDTFKSDVVDDKDVGHRSASVKSKSRVWAKVFRDYSEEYEFPDAYFMVQDWIRCAIVVKTSSELLALYKLICSDKYFGGKIIRIKNGLETRAKAEFGYRVIMINAVYKGMIVEMQCMLLPFLKMRKKMHVHYKIIRAQKSNDLAQDMGSIIG